MATVQAARPVVLVHNGMFPVLTVIPISSFQSLVYLPDSGSKLVINAEVAAEDCGYTACRRGRERPGLWSSSPGCIQHVGSLFSVSRCVEKCGAEAKARLHHSSAIML